MNHFSIVQNVLVFSTQILSVMSPVLVKLTVDGLTSQNKSVTPRIVAGQKIQDIHTALTPVQVTRELNI